MGSLLVCLRAARIFGQWTGTSASDQVEKSASLLPKCLWSLCQEEELPGGGLCLFPGVAGPGGAEPD